MRTRRPRLSLPRLEELETRAVPSASTAPAFQAVPGAWVAPARAGSSQNSQPVGYTPAQIRHAYGFDQVSFNNGAVAANGAGQTIAIVDVYDDPNILSDANYFSKYFNLPQFNGGTGTPTFTKVNEKGSANGPFPNSNSSWAGEISLDVEWAHAIAPEANIVLVESGSTYLSDLSTAINTARNWAGVSAVSMSWGGSEFNGITSYDADLTTPSGHSNVTFTAATLDNGAYYHGFTAAYWPAVSPNALAVGGTVLTLNSDNTWSSESGWSQGGGGLSKYESQPSYQSGVVPQSTTQRANPDVAYAAGAPGFAVYDTVPYNRQTGWLDAEGTSAGTPQWAALVAIADQGRALQGLTALDGPGQVLPTLYGLYSSSSYASDFHDVTTGSNGYSAGTGYDLVTGLGTPQAAAIIQALVNAPAAPSGAQTTSGTGGNGPVGGAVKLDVSSGASAALPSPAQDALARPSTPPDAPAPAVVQPGVPAPAVAAATGSTTGINPASLAGAGTSSAADEGQQADGWDQWD